MTLLSRIHVIWPPSQFFDKIIIYHLPTYWNVHMVTINSFQGRLLTRQELDTRPMDTATAYRFCYGLLPSNVTAKFDPENRFANVTVNRFAKWVQRIDIIMPAAAQSGSAAALADEPQSQVSSSNSTLKWGLIGGAIIIIGIIAIVFIRRKDIAKAKKLTSK